jgi:hypothetical protein
MLNVEWADRPPRGEKPGLATDTVAHSPFNILHSTFTILDSTLVPSTLLPIPVSPS